VLPPQSPARVGALPAAAPAIVMSRKSQSAADKFATVRVRGVPVVFDRRVTRLIALAPAQVKVPLTIWLSDMRNCSRPEEAGGTTVRLLNVHDPKIAKAEAEPLLKV